MICRCHSSDLYANLRRCPACGHQSFDAYTWIPRDRGQPLEGSCERRKCGYEGPAEQPQPQQGKLL